MVHKKVVKSCESIVKALKAFFKRVHVHWFAAVVDGASFPCVVTIVSSVSWSAVSSYVLKVFIRGVHVHWLVAGVDGASVPCLAIIVLSVSWSAVPSIIQVFGSGCRCSKLSKLACEYRWSLSHFTFSVYLRVRVPSSRSLPVQAGF